MPSNLQSASALKYSRLATHLRRQIESGALSTGDRLPSFAQLRAQFGANATTVERAYKVLEQENLIVREHRRGVFVAEPQRKTLTGVIGVGGITFAQRRRFPYYSHLMEGIQQAAENAQREILLLRDASAIRWEKVDGVLLNPTHDIRTQPALSLPPGMPCVSLLAPLDGVVSVTADEAGGVRAAMQHLLELGHRRIAFLISPILTQRIAAYHGALQAAGIAPLPEWIRHARGETGRTYREIARTAMQQWLREDWKKLGCTAIITQNDDAATGVLEALGEAELNVPEEVSVVGFDGTEISELSTPALTTVELPLQEIGAMGVELLLRQMQGEPVKIAALALPTRLQTRASTTTAPQPKTRDAKPKSTQRKNQRT